MELSKYITSVPQELNRSEINLADYNPRVISEEAKKSIKRGIKKFGLLGGVIVNRATGMTIVSGHQRVAVMDDLNKYPENDYILRVDVIEVGEKEEKELNILLNNPNAQGSWDFDLLREIIPDIDYKIAGLTAEDLNSIGVDYLLKTDEESAIADALNDVGAPVREAKKIEKELTDDEKIAHNKEVKGKVKAEAEERAENMDAYVMLSFDTFKQKKAFMQRFGFDERDKFIKGEVFSDMIERVE